MNYREELSKTDGDYNKIFKLVRRLVEEKLNLSRGPMLLGVTYTDPRIGAYHPVGSNAMILNLTVLDAIKIVTDKKLEISSYVFVILLHEYLHSLGYKQEREVRPLTLRLCLEAFGRDHPATEMALDPFSYFPGLIQILQAMPVPRNRPVKYLGDFDNENVRFYI